MSRLYSPKQIPELNEPAPIVWRQNLVDYCDEVMINDILVGWMTPRPGYCDRGRFAVYSNLPGIDAADGFPRYYFDRAVAVSETEAFLRWRLWRERK